MFVGILHLTILSILFILTLTESTSNSVNDRIGVGEKKTGVLNTIFTGRVSPRNTHGLLIDGGSGGSRMHIYSWAPRVFKTVPPPISFPTTNDQTSMAKMSGGVQNCWQPNQDPDELAARVRDHFLPLIDFAREKLAGKESIFHSIPIWFKATGGARELPPSARNELLTAIRKLLTHESPFYFRDEMARVISGEEEAVFSWACMNFLKGNLIPAAEGFGQVTRQYDSGHSYGTLDLGGSSTQIAFFLPSEDYMEGLYKLQIGGQKHWNVYTKSFLEFGINSARRRHYSLLALNAVRAMQEGNKNYLEIFEVTPQILDGLEDLSGNDPSFSEGSVNGVVNARRKLWHADDVRVNDKSRRFSMRNPCFHSGYEEKVEDIVLDLGNPEQSTVSVTIKAPEKQHSDGRVQLDMCLQQLRPLMEKSSNGYCNMVYHGECSIGGGYQPTLPQGEFRHFFATSSYKLPWAILRLEPNVTLEAFADAAGTICAMSLSEAEEYAKKYELSEVNPKLASEAQYFCFMAAYTLTLLEDGYGFSKADTITVIDKVNGFATGWALGAILHEINNLPWELDSTRMYEPWVKDLFIALAGLILGAFLGVRFYLGLGRYQATLTPTAGASESESADRMPESTGDVAMTSNETSGTPGIFQAMPFSSSNKGYQQLDREDI